MEVPEPKGYNEEGGCIQCGSEDTAVSSPYMDPDKEVEVHDVYCENCGTVLEQIKVDDNNAS